MTGPPEMASPRRSGRVGPIGFAHRGGRAESPENTIEAFARALELGATGLESDAWLTADGGVVLDHDGVTGPVWRRRSVAALTYSKLPGHIPTLTELYQLCGTGFELSLDVKDPAVLHPLLEVAKAAGADSRLWLCHHDWRLLAGWKRSTGPAHLVESTRVDWMPEGLAARTAALAAAGIEVVNLHRREWDPDRVAIVHAAGLLAFGWDAQSQTDIAHLADLGVEGIYSDHVDRLMAVLGPAAEEA